MLMLAVLSISAGCTSARQGKGIDPTIDIDTLPPTIINPPPTHNPGILVDTTSSDQKRMGDFWFCRGMNMSENESK